MPIVVSNGYEIVTQAENDRRTKLSEIIANTIREKFGNEFEITPDLTFRILCACFKIAEKEFLSRIRAQNEAAFYLFVHNFNENSSILWARRIRRQELEIDTGSLVTSRRVYKIIMEQACGVNLISSPSYPDTMSENQSPYLELLEDLIFIGSWAIKFSEDISKQKMFPNACKVEWQNEELHIKYHPHFDAALDHFEVRLEDHDSDIAVHETLSTFNEIWRTSYGLEFNKISSFLNYSERLRNGVADIRRYIDSLAINIGCDRRIVQTYFDGLTVCRSNFMSFEKCIKENQNINRILCRPLLKLHIDDRELYIIGLHKWSEAMTFLAYNCFPFGVYAEEWKAIPQITEYMNNVNNAHDLVLENPIAALLTERSIPFSHKVKSIRVTKSNSIVIWKMKGVGEIDFVFYRQSTNTLYVCECKHNRSKFEYSGWYKDTTKFRVEFETQLCGKIDWVKQNTNAVLRHLELDNGIKIASDTTLQVVGIFIVNAPTLYMYDSSFPTFTIYSLRSFLDEGTVLEDAQIHGESGEIIEYRQPILTNINSTINNDW